MLRMSLRACVPLVVLGALITATPAGATPAKVGPSTSIDALGDSITRGYDSQGSGCGTLADCPANSWATGTNAGVNSYYTRLKALNPSVLLAQPVKTSTTGGNDAVTGAKMGDLPGQAKNAVNAPNTPDQVMILLGANDVCTSTEASMTSVASFRASYKSGLETLSKGIPNARIDVSSIPNIFNLWSVLHTSGTAQLIWGLGKICQSMLAKPTSEAAADKERRAKVQIRNQEFNTVLGEVCAEFIHCQYDKGAAYAIKFESKDVGTVDYFHPNTSGQAKAAENAWLHGPSFADLSTPTTTITPDRGPDAAEGWYDNDVQLTLNASDIDDGVAGTEYKLTGAAPWTRYTGPITVGDGQTTITARSVDTNGNIEESQSLTVKVDKTAPNAPSASPDRAPDYAGGGGWYANTVTVSFSDNGDALLSDGSEGSGVNGATLSAPQTFNTDGSHEASGTVADNVGNVSSPGTLSVQVDVSAPTVEASCPASATIGAKGVNATVTASDGQSGLAEDPSGSHPIDTSTGGVKTVKVTAIDNVGHETEASCSTPVYTQVITTNLKGNLTIKAGQFIKLANTAKVSGNVLVKPGGAVDVEGGSISGNFSAKEASLIRVCDANISGTTKVIASSGSVVIGEGDEACGSSSLHGTATVKANKAGVLIDENVFFAALKVLNNEGGTTVINNKVAGELVVKGNTGTVIDTPNQVEGKSKIQ
jgi:lysophospholipase L1-like esterase